ncbi:penicillin-binding protein 2 [candidate division KSB3 bacterium]|uniref:Penicillin-binding protein 2 n=1 Tax=candidate division KSB3 bacterium TaxID=2044937 RepID=A0A9D5Q8G6_9BACT|nr:penicillin-binding protein 2 [candidate division KSB3 bacterium]MBD3327327.1 penicillin-binding protein 2 [candidate division KSB3 bacterium]
MINQATTTKASFRLKVYSVIVLMLFAVLFVRLWHLQIIQGSTYWVKSEENRIRLLRVKAPRGIISDTDGFALVRNRPSFNVFIIQEDVQNLENTAKRLEGLLPISHEDILKKVKASRRPTFEPILIYRDVNLKTVAYLEEHKIELPGVLVEVEPLRYYIYDSSACHVLGYLGEITEEQLKDKDTYPDSRQGDLIGKSGIEKTFNLYLKGNAGGKQVEVNAYGREIGIMSQKNPVPGHNITLTLNLRIQLLAEEAMEGKSGAVVAVNPQNGHILAMVSRPAFNPNLFAGELSSTDWNRLSTDASKPFRNRTIQSHYAPGSTFKIMVGSALLQNGVVKENTVLHCAGSVHLANTRKRCWKAGGHKYLTIKQALEQSCNVFFYRAGLELGIDELSRYAKAFGFGQRSNIELPNEVPGLIPTRDWKKEFNGERWYPSETMDAAIGQGFVTVTPLQLANMVATVANGGTFYQPMLVKKITKANGDLVKEYQPTEIRQLPIQEQFLQIIREGMWMVVNGKRGTARGSQIEDFEFAGKTGTAQVVRMKGRDDQESLPEHLRDHGLFVGFAPIENPEIALAIVVENGMGGSRSAAPVAKFILERLYKPQDFLVRHEEALPET